MKRKFILTGLILVCFAVSLWPHLRAESAGVQSRAARSGRAPVAVRARDSVPVTIDVEDLEGAWTNTRGHGKGINIRLRDPQTHALSLTETFGDWQGSYTPTSSSMLLLGQVASAEPLDFTRVPSVAQMTPTLSFTATGILPAVAPPLWALEMVQGTLRWSLELHLKQGTRRNEWILAGDFYPGAVSWRETTDAATGVVLDRYAWVSGKGTPRPVSYHSFDDG